MSELNVIPTIKEIREVYVKYGRTDGPMHPHVRKAEFDQGLADAVKRETVKALREAAESTDLIGHMYMFYDDHSTQSPLGVRATATYLQDRADQMEGDE